MTIRVDFDKYILNLLLLPIHEDQWNRSRTSFVLPAKVEDLRVFRIIIIYLENEHINVRHLSSSEDHRPRWVLQKVSQRKLYLLVPVRQSQLPARWAREWKEPENLLDVLLIGTGIVLGLRKSNRIRTPSNQLNIMILHAGLYPFFFFFSKTTPGIEFQYRSSSNRGNKRNRSRTGQIYLRFFLDRRRFH